MNRKELEKMFEEQVCSTRIYNEYGVEVTDDITKFIFEIFLKEVLKEIKKETDRFMFNWQIKDISMELYGIKL